MGEVDALSALIKQLFGNGEQGAFYLPQPVVNGQQVLFQDADGTTAAGAQGAQEGLRLDVSRSLTLGSELFQGWDSGQASFSGNAAPSGQGLAVTPGDGTSRAIYQVGSAAGTYLVEFAATISAGDGLALRLGDQGWSGAFSSVTSSGLVSLKITSNGEAQALRFGALSGASDAFSVTGLTVRSLAGSHAIQRSAVLRPTYSTASPQHVFSAGSKEMFVPVYTQQGTVVRVVASSVSESYPVDMSTGYTITEDHDSLIVIDRKLSATELEMINEFFAQ